MSMSRRSWLQTGLAAGALAVARKQASGQPHDHAGHGAGAPPEPSLPSGPRPPLPPLEVPPPAPTVAIPSCPVPGNHGSDLTD